MWFLLAQLGFFGKEIQEASNEVAMAIGTVILIIIVAAGVLGLISLLIHTIGVAI